MQRLKIQALVGQATSVSVAIAYVAAIAAKVTLWPWAILLAVVAASFIAGWLLYSEHDAGGARNDGVRSND